MITHQSSDSPQIQGLKFEDYCVRYIRYYIQANHKEYGLVRSGWETHNRDINPISPLDFDKKKAKSIVHQLGLSSKFIGRMPDITIVKWLNKRHTKFVIQSFIECKQGHDRYSNDGKIEHAVSVKNGQSELLKDIIDIGFKVDILASARSGTWFYTTDYDHSLLSPAMESMEYKTLVLEKSQSFRDHLSLFSALEHLTEYMRLK